MNKVKIGIIVLLLLVFATSGWGVKKWVGMSIEDCTFIEDGTTQTATIAEINTACDGITATATEINQMDRDKVTMFTDFMGDVIDGTTNLLKGEGGGTGNTVAIAAGESGNLSIKTASDDGDHAANGSMIAGDNLNWRADSGGMMMEVALQIDNIAKSMIFVGFTDVSSGTIEAPIFLNGADIDSDADNACGIVYDTDGTTEQWCHGGVKAGTDTTPAYSGTAPVNATDVTLKVEVSAAGAVTGYVNGTAIGTAVANAVTATTPLTPAVVVINRSAAARTVLLDYMYVQSNRR